MAVSSSLRTLARLWSVFALALWLALGVSTVHAQGQGLAVVGPIDPANGYPQYFQDRAGLALDQCLTDPTTTTPVADPCTLAGTLTNGANAALPDGPVVFPTSFPPEFFYMRAVSRIDGIGGGTGTAARATLTMALEGAFVGAGTVADGQQILFARFRIKVPNLTPNATYTLTYPYGVRTFQADTGGVINFTDDQGCLAVPCGDFASVLSTTNVGPFLQWDPAVAPAAPLGYIGDPLVDHSIVGSPFNTNLFRLDGPNVGGSGVNTISTNLFTIIGKRFNGLVATALSINRTSYVRDSSASAQLNVFATSSGNATVVASDVGIPTTTLLGDAVSGRFFASILPTSPANLPANIRITAGAPGTDLTVRDSALVDEVTISMASFDLVAQNLTIQAASSDLVAPPTLTATTSDPVVPLGTLSALGRLVVPMTVPPAKIIVSSSKGGVSTLPVSLRRAPPIATTTTVVASANPSQRSLPVTLTATVAAVSGTLVPSGTVIFSDGATTLGAGTLNASGVAALTLAANTLSAGTHPITAVYGGNLTFAGSPSAALNLLVNDVIATTTSVAASANPTAVNQPVTLTATVTPTSGTTIPSGTVTFRDGATSLGTATLDAAGHATLTRAANTFTVATHPITAVYAGSTTFGGSTSAALSLVVTAPPLIATTTSLAASANPILSNQSVTLTVTVTPASGTTVPSGSVNFRDGTTNLGTVTLNGSGQATLTFPAGTLAVGTHPLTAVYGGSASFNGSTSAVLNLVVTAPALVGTTTSVTSTPNPSSGFLQNVTFTATVRPVTGTTIPTGTVTFKDGTTTMGTATLNGAGVATFQRLNFNLTVGSHNITAVYGGSAAFSTSTSPVLVHVRLN